MKSLHTELVIDASPEKVWKILTDFKSYPEWNPFVIKLEGEAKVGTKLKVIIHPPKGKPMTFTPKCLAADDNAHFRWLGHLLMPGLFDGEHFFKLKAVDGGRTKFVQGENFQGILVPLFWGKMKDNTMKGFELMNKALKERAESA